MFFEIAKVMEFGGSAKGFGRFFDFGRKNVFKYVMGKCENVKINMHLRKHFATNGNLIRTSTHSLIRTFAKLQLYLLCLHILVHKHGCTEVKLLGALCREEVASAAL